MPMSKDKTAYSVRLLKEDFSLIRAMARKSKLSVNKTLAGIILRSIKGEGEPLSTK